MSDDSADSGRDSQTDDHELTQTSNTMSQTEPESDRENRYPNRADIMLLWDAVNCNPNGDPLSSNNRPRVDLETEQAIVSPYRIKRYLRDQLFDDGEDILIKSDVQNGLGRAASRNELFEQIDEKLDAEPGADDDDETGTGAYVRELLDRAADIRLFGAALSIEPKGRSKEIGKALPRKFRGPVQFEMARSLHATTANDESSQITTVISSGERDDGEAREQGTFGEDNRLKYALIAGDGVVDSANARHTRLTAADVDQLGDLWWRAMKNQTGSVSKVGQTPRLFLHVEYEGAFNEGQLSNLLDLDTEGTPDEQLRTLSDLTVNATRLVERLGREGVADRIVTVHVIAHPDLAVRVGDEMDTSPSMLIDALRDRVGDERVDVIDPYTDIDWSALTAATGMIIDDSDTDNADDD